MKQTSKNLHGQGVLKLLSPNVKRLELTTSGKVHTEFGILCEFTHRADAVEALIEIGFKESKGQLGSFVAFKMSKHRAQKWIDDLHSTTNPEKLNEGQIAKFMAIIDGLQGVVDGK